MGRKEITMANLNVNLLALGGRLTADPELKTTTTGISLATFSVAVTRPGRKDEEKKTDFFDCTAWRSTAEFIARYFKKGSSIFLTGSIQFRFYEKDGKTNKVAEVVVKEATFVDSLCERDKEIIREEIAAEKYGPNYDDVPREPQFEDITDEATLPF